MESLSGLKGFDRDTFCRVHDSGEQVVAIRCNPAKFSDEFTARYNGAGKIPWSSCGYYLSERPSFILDPLWHAGAYYVQDASSMFLEHVVRSTCDLSLPLRVLDLCAAPGGKSTLLQSLINEESLLVSNEVIRSRAGILEENISRWGGANVIITQNDPADLGKGEEYFDLIVADVPCSGSGLFRKDPESLKEWSVSHVDHCAARQKRILSGILPALAPGGVFVYSTCSYSPAEDEEIVDFLIEEFGLESVSTDVDAEWKITETKSPVKGACGYRFFPDKVRGEGFFIAAFRKSGNNIPRLHSKPIGLKKPSKSEMKVVESYCSSGDHLFFFNDSKELRYWTAPVLDGILNLQPFCYIRKAGVRVGEIIREDFIPDPEWALGGLVGKGIPSIEMETEEALDYLRLLWPQRDIPVPGWYLIRYMGLGLGWIKAMKGRVNNYYPRSWRILNK